VCTTELGEVARRDADFKARSVKVIGISANTLRDHTLWVRDINDYGGKVGPTDVQFPIVSSFVLIQYNPTLLHFADCRSRQENLGVV
jgi:alkyl hydroperoxide reductase subunit AhpC